MKYFRILATVLVVVFLWSSDAGANWASTTATQVCKRASILEKVKGAFPRKFIARLAKLSRCVGGKKKVSEILKKEKIDQKVSANTYLRIAYVNHMASSNDCRMFFKEFNAVPGFSSVARDIASEKKRGCELVKALKMITQIVDLGFRVLRFHNEWESLQVSLQKKNNSYCFIIDLDELTDLNPSHLAKRLRDLNIQAKENGICPVYLVPYEKIKDDSLDLFEKKAREEGIEFFKGDPKQIVNQIRFLR